MRPPRLRCTLFPLIYPPHLLVLPATFGLHLLLQTYPYFRALYVISVRRTKSLLTASFRFHLTMDTLAVRLYTSSLPRRVRDFHPLERAHGAQTKRSITLVMLLLPKSFEWDSNPRPTHYECVALPSEPSKHIIKFSQQIYFTPFRVENQAKIVPIYGTISANILSTQFFLL